MAFFKTLKDMLTFKKLPLDALSDPVLWALISLTGIALATHSTTATTVAFVAELALFLRFSLELYSFRAKAIITLFNHPFFEKRLTAEQKMLLHMGILIHPKKQLTRDEIKAMTPLVTCTSWKTTQILIDKLCALPSPLYIKLIILDEIRNPPMLTIVYPEKQKFIDSRKEALLYSKPMLKSSLVSMRYPFGKSLFIL